MAHASIFVMSTVLSSRVTSDGGYRLLIPAEVAAVSMCRKCSGAIDEPDFRAVIRSNQNAADFQGETVAIGRRQGPCLTPSARASIL